MPPTEEFGPQDLGSPEPLSSREIELENNVSMYLYRNDALDNRLLAERMRHPMDAINLAFEMVSVEIGIEVNMREVAKIQGISQDAIKIYDDNIDDYEDIIHEASIGSLVGLKKFLINRAENNEADIKDTAEEFIPERRKLVSRLHHQSRLIPLKMRIGRG